MWQTSDYGGEKYIEKKYLLVKYTAIRILKIWAEKVAK